MNLVLTSGFWLETVGVLALEVMVVCGGSGLLAARRRSGRQQRFVWVACFVTLGALAVNLATGADRGLVNALRARAVRRPQFALQANLPTDRSAAAASTAPQAPPDWSGAIAAPTGLADRPVKLVWPAGLWLAGIVGLGAWGLVRRAALAWVGHRRGRAASEQVTAEVQALALRLGGRRRVRVVYLTDLPGPIAYGILRPTIGLPLNFETAYSQREREAMLLHELAHLVSGDPVWHWLAEGVTCLLWWHPLVWRSRTQLRAASEMAADEVSLLVEDGPTVLARCLVALARTLEGQRGTAPLGMVGRGFRSGLGRRIERLLRLRRSDLPGTRRPGALNLVVSGGLLAAALGLVAVAVAWPVRSAASPTLLALAWQSLAGESTPAERPAVAVPVQYSASYRLRVVGEKASELRQQVIAVLIRRLAAFDLASVSCEPRGADELNVRVVVDTAETLALMPSLLEQRGWLEFRPVHPESDQLAETNAAPEGYELLTQHHQSGGAARRFVVAREPAGPNSSHVASAAALNGRPVIGVVFTADGERGFLELTRTNVGHQLAVVVDHQLLTAPRVNEPIRGGRCELAGAATALEAQVLATLIAQPLPGRVELVSPTNAPVAVPTPPARRPENVPIATTQAVIRSDPVRASTAPDTSGMTNVGALIQDAKLLYEMGKLPEAKAKAEAVLRREPDNRAADYYLRLIQASEAATQARRRETTARSREGALLYPTLPPTPVTPGTNELFTRTYKLNLNALMTGFEASSGSAATHTPVVELLRRYLTIAGADFGGAENRLGAGFGGYQSPTGKTLLLNERAGTLLVRASLKDLDLVETALQILNEAPPQVMIDARFVEITGDDALSLGLDWLLGTLPPGNSPTNALSATNTPLTVTGLMSDPQVRGLLPTNAGAPTGRVEELRGDDFAWAGQQITNARNLRVTAARGPAMTGILTDPQSRVLLRALEQRRGVEVLSAPRVTTLSGRKAQIQIVDVRTFVTGINPTALVQPGVWGRTNIPTYTTASLAVGPSLEVVPTVSADGGRIELTVTPTLTEFLGYETAPKETKVHVWQNGVKKWVTPPLPRFRVRQMETKASVADGQTLMLGTWPVPDYPANSAKDPPTVIRPAGRDSKPAATRRLLVFVTPTIIDAAGNRVQPVPTLPAAPDTSRAPATQPDSGTGP